ncbi:MAG: hypothetical protein LLF98_12555 [Clostridium sp.]|uniref:hypothetical protein n=1 Tax=Clostridium sp. TaxID=1506 RepID=UPI0025BCCF6C|nr:hypothetical protein [Clostridium sp.]MCE5222049.1 hypothetical protein [Clostridium sp.]
MDINGLIVILITILANSILNCTLKDFYLNVEILRKAFKINIKIGFSTIGKDT